MTSAFRFLGPTWTIIPPIGLVFGRGIRLASIRVFVRLSAYKRKGYLRLEYLIGCHHDTFFRTVEEIVLSRLRRRVNFGEIDIVSLPAKALERPPFAKYQPWLSLLQDSLIFP